MKTYRIMIAEDDPDDRFLMESALEEINCECQVEWINDGNSLKNRLAESKLPSILMMDLNMPKIDGRQMLKFIKTTPRLQHLPVMIISTSAAEEEVKNAYQNGAAAYFVKPAKYDDLVAMLKSIIHFYCQTATLAFEEAL
ncbi:response regulator [Jiulongibacter sp. NS-SX5]|uniref:response regulator n=1 Tax=Jiulongibacter sp. NS-SX5 TaxID=3463854 RepID=UPI004058D409